jgi:hypothetical protein
VYGPKDDVDPIVTVGHSKEAVENKLAWAISVHCQDQPEGVEFWITYPAVEHTYED